MLPVFFLQFAAEVIFLHEDRYVSPIFLRIQGLQCALITFRPAVANDGVDSFRGQQPREFIGDFSYGVDKKLSRQVNAMLLHLFLESSGGNIMDSEPDNPMELPLPHQPGILDGDMLIVPENRIAAGLAGLRVIDGIHDNQGILPLQELVDVVYPVFRRCDPEQPVHCHVFNLLGNSKVPVQIQVQEFKVAIDISQRPHETGQNFGQGSIKIIPGAVMIEDAHNKRNRHRQFRIGEGALPPRQTDQMLGLLERLNHGAR